MIKIIAVLLFSTPLWGQSAALLMANVSGGGGGCSLSYQTNLSAWYKADAGLTCTGGCTTGNPVTAWADQSSNGNNLSPGGVNVPTYQSSGILGLPAVQFAAASSEWFIQSTALDLTTGVTVFAVLKLTTNPHTGYDLFSGGGAGSIEYAQDNGGAGPQGVNKTSTVILVTGTSGSDTSYHQVNFVYVAGTSATLRKDRAADGTASFSTVLTAGSNIHLVGSGATGFLNGQITEMLIYGASLSSPNVTTVENYLNCRSGL